MVLQKYTDLPIFFEIKIREPLRSSFGTSLGENYTLYDKDTQQHIWKVAKENSDFGNGLASSLTKIYNTLDNQTKKEINVLAAE